jgi:ABC-type nitrate/sulfonate/bicarbonate transport system permease component
MGDVAIQWLVIVALAALWQAVASAKLVDPFLLPPLSQVLHRLGGDILAGTALVDLSLTLYRALVGFAVAAVLAIPLGVLMSRSRALRWFVDPIISVGFPMPKIAFLPIFILWFGLYDSSKIIMIAFSAFFPIVSATVAGTSSVDRWPLWSARALGASERDLLWEIILPAASPQILTGLQIALPVALITTVVTEMMMGGSGVGGSMITAGRFADSVGVFSGLIEISALGFVVIYALQRIRARLLAWHPESAHR